MNWFFLALLFSPILGCAFLAASDDLSDTSSSSAPQQEPPKLSYHDNSEARLENLASGQAASNEIEPSDAMYAAALAECDSANRSAGLWAKCFAAERGDETRARALYTARRARSMHAEMVAEQIAELEKTEHGRKILAQRAEDAVPKGTCPNCSAVIPLASEICPKPACGAVFGSPGGWRVEPLT